MKTKNNVKLLTANTYVEQRIKSLYNKFAYLPQNVITEIIEDNNLNLAYEFISYAVSKQKNITDEIKKYVLDNYGYYVEHNSIEKAIVSNNFKCIHILLHPIFKYSTECYRLMLDKACDTRNDSVIMRLLLDFRASENLYTVWLPRCIVTLCKTKNTYSTQNLVLGIVKRFYSNKQIILKPSDLYYIINLAIKYENDKVLEHFLEKYNFTLEYILRNHINTNVAYTLIKYDKIAGILDVSYLLKAGIDFNDKKYLNEVNDYLIYTIKSKNYKVFEFIINNIEPLHLCIFTENDTISTLLEAPQNYIMKIADKIITKTFSTKLSQLITHVLIEGGIKSKLYNELFNSIELIKNKYSEKYRQVINSIFNKGLLQSGSSILINSNDYNYITRFTALFDNLPKHEQAASLLYNYNGSYELFDNLLTKEAHITENDNYTLSEILIKVAIHNPNLFNILINNPRFKESFHEHHTSILHEVIKKTDILKYKLIHKNLFYLSNISNSVYSALKSAINYNHEIAIMIIKDKLCKIGILAKLQEIETIILYCNNCEIYDLFIKVDHNRFKTEASIKTHFKIAMRYNNFVLANHIYNNIMTKDNRDNKLWNNKAMILSEHDSTTSPVLKEYFIKFSDNISQEVLLKKLEESITKKYAETQNFKWLLNYIHSHKSNDILNRIIETINIHELRFNKSTLQLISKINRLSDKNSKTFTENINTELYYHTKPWHEFIHHIAHDISYNRLSADLWWKILDLSGNVSSWTPILFLKVYKFVALNPCGKLLAKKLEESIIINDIKTFNDIYQDTILHNYLLKTDNYPIAMMFIYNRTNMYNSIFEFHDIKESIKIKNSNVWRWYNNEPNQNIKDNFDDFIDNIFNVNVKKPRLSI